LKTNKATVKAVCADRADRDMAAIKAAMAVCFDSADYKEGRKAFMEKRKPAFHRGLNRPGLFLPVSRPAKGMRSRNSALRPFFWLALCCAAPICALQHRGCEVHP